MKPISLNIGGYSILVSLTKQFHDSQFGELFMEFVRTHYQQFVGSSKTVDYHIKVVEERRPYIMRKGTELFLKVTDIHNTYLTTYTYISPYEFDLLLRKVIFILLKSTKDIQVHASSCLLPSNQVVLFIGNSGLGKSTAVRYLQKFASPFTDDIIIIRKMKNVYVGFQTPFYQKTIYPILKKGYPISRIFVLTNKEFSQECHIKTMFIPLLLDEINYGFIDECLEFIRSMKKSIQVLRYPIKLPILQKELEELFQQSSNQSIYKRAKGKK